MSRYFANRLKPGVTSGTPGVYHPKSSSILGPPALGHSRQVLLTGTVVSTAMQKTINVSVSQFTRHPIIPRYIRRTRKHLAHDESEEARWGDIVEIRECRPLSRHKHFALHRIVTPRASVDWSGETPPLFTHRTIRAEAEKRQTEGSQPAQAVAAVDVDGKQLSDELGRGKQADNAYREMMQRKMVARK